MLSLLQAGFRCCCCWSCLTLDSHKWYRHAGFHYYLSLLVYIINYYILINVPPTLIVNCPTNQNRHSHQHVIPLPRIDLFKCSFSLCTSLFLLLFLLLLLLLLRVTITLIILSLLGGLHCEEGDFVFVLIMCHQIASNRTSALDELGLISCR